jgi:hypothetical protein
MSGVFSPVGATFAITVSSSSNRQGMTDLNALCGAVRVRNGNASAVFLKFGDSTVSATTDDMPLSANATEILKPPPGSTHLAVRGQGSGNPVEMTVGQV